MPRQKHNTGRAKYRWLSRKPHRFIVNLETEPGERPRTKIIEIKQGEIFEPTDQMILEHQDLMEPVGLSLRAPETALLEPEPVA